MTKEEVIQRITKNKTQDFRVVCINQKKVFSCVESAAKVLNIPSKDVVFCCDGWVNMTATGDTLQWYFVHLEKTPKAKQIHPTIPEFVDVTLKETTRDIFRKNNLSIKTYLRKFRSTYRLIWLWSQEDPDTLTEWMAVSEFAEKLRLVALEHEIIEDDEDSKRRYSGRAISRHLNSRLKYYNHHLNLAMKRAYSKEKRRKTTFVKLSYIKNIVPFKKANEAGLFESFLDEDSIYYGGPIFGYPVICLETNDIFSSITVASKITGVTPNHILWNCKGDIDSTLHFCVKRTFRFANILNPEIKGQKNLGRDYQTIEETYAKGKLIW